MRLDGLLRLQDEELETFLLGGWVYSGCGAWLQCGILYIYIYIYSMYMYGSVVVYGSILVHHMYLPINGM